MDNYAIADQLSLLSKLMDIHGENAFKTKSYAAAAFAIEKAPKELSTYPAQKIFAIKGIGESVGAKVIELLEKGEIKAVGDYLSKTPQGVLDMLHLKGLGPKKINIIWKELGIDTINDLAEACKQNRLAKVKGFGEKTEEKILESIEFQQQHKGLFLFAQIEAFAEAFTIKLKEAFSGYKTEITGAYKRQWDVIEKLEWVTTVPKDDLKRVLAKEGLNIETETADLLTLVAENSATMMFHLTTDEVFYKTLFAHNSSEEFMQSWRGLSLPGEHKIYSSEEDIFKTAGLPFIPPFLREKKAIISQAKTGEVKDVIQAGDIKGLIHAHSNWSDGGHTIEQMANELIGLGFEYLVLSDHSKAAYYANGLTEQRIREQHKDINALNKKLAPFKIYKSIECDILSDGALDYSNEVLSSFDLVIASVHSNLQMTEDKAMKRLLGAIENPYTTILGHMTGRLLLKRPGYPVDHAQIIDACAQHSVAIEINAHPVRLDIGWQWVELALEKNLFLSINPDAHTLEEFSNIKYGVLVAQKGGLTKEHNLSSMSRDEFEKFLLERKKLRGI